MKWCMFLFLFFSLVAHGQENLVPNGGFERYDHCPSTPPVQIQYFVNNWFTAVQSPDYYHSCGANGYQIPINNNGYASAFDSAYIGLVLWHKPFSLREFIGVRLKESLNSSTKYHFELWIQSGDTTTYAVRNISVWFKADTLPTQSSHQEQQTYLLSQEPQVKYTGAEFLQNREEWVKISGDFIAEGGEDFMFLGNFDTDEETDTLFIGGSTQNPQWVAQAYVYIDNVSLVEDSTTSISEPETFKTYVYPNPNDGRMYLDYQGLKGDTYFEMYDMVGRKVATYSLQGEVGKISISETQLNSGIYFYRILGKHQILETGKVIIQK